MTRTRATVTSGRREALLEKFFEAPAWARGHAHGAAPVRGHAGEVCPEPQIDDIEDQVLSVLEIFTQGSGARATPQDSQRREGA
ncbi:hypothetical protein KY290_027519 [Solanum tuberosum]|uniref:Integrase core domain containing protein n=1 Tax=Solanum tuberosum TaxID=4113 RepID=A0ABQ7UFE1_SOLTU|nr:hypothetical protein KY285_026455 [Solanum tuberosum]KAH0748287.1 hypothetical protein KY290_027519 [Solanum tuberosum]